MGYYIAWGDVLKESPDFYQTATSYAPPIVREAGVYYLRVRARDKAGNYTGWKTFTFRYDYLAPTNPTTVQVTKDEGGLPTFTWSRASDAHSGLSRYNVYWGTQPAGTSDFSTASSSYTAPAAPNLGTYYLRLRVQDVVGNYSHWSTLYTETIEHQPQEISKYYYLGGQRVAMRKPNGEINYLLGDQLGSTSLVTSASGEAVYTARYMPFGELRSTSGATLTDFGYIPLRGTGRAAPGERLRLDGLSSQVAAQRSYGEYDRTCPNNNKV